MAAGDRAPNGKEASAAAVGRRAAARLTAVQALYQIEIAGVGVDQAIAQFLAGEAPQGDGEDGPSAALPAPDPDLFAAIVGGVVLAWIAVPGLAVLVVWRLFGPRRPRGGEAGGTGSSA